MKIQFAKRYRDLEEWHWWFRGRQRILATVLRRELPSGASRAVASLGCGPAEGLAWLEPFAGQAGRIVGMDFERVHAPPTGASCSYVIGSCEAVPFTSTRFDLVLMLDVLEHLDNDTAGLSEAVRVLKPGGLILVTVPALPSLWGGQDVVSQHRRRYTRRTLAELFARAGLAGARFSYFNSLLFPLVAAVRWGRSAAGLANRPRSDFDDSKPGLANEILATVFGAERRLIGRVPMPVGVSLLGSARVSLAKAEA
jgi:SAM-dependent methyltransferase